MIRNYLTVILRSFWRFRLYSFLNLMGLAIALAVATLIIVYVRDEVGYDRHFSKADRIYRIANFSTSGSRARNWANGAPLMAEEITSFIPEIESITRMNPFNEVVLEYYADSLNVTSHLEKDGFFIDSTFLDIFDVEIIHGNSIDPVSKPGSIILTESLSQKFFAGENPVGKTINIRGLPWEITAVCSDFPEQQHFHPSFFVPWQNFIDFFVEAGLSEVYYSRGWSGVYTYILLDENTNPADLMDKLLEFRIDFYSDGLNREEAIESGRFVLQPLLDIHLKSHLEQEIEANGNIVYVLVSIIAALFILIIAGVNYINLANVMAIKRIKEVGIRKVSGARQNQLIGQFLGESLFIAFLSGIAAILAMDLLLPLFKRITELSLESLDLLTFQNLGPLMGLVLILGLISGTYPALFASRFSPIQAMNELKDPGSLSNRVRIGLVILQFTVSIFMIFSTIIIYRQMNYFLGKDMGWDKENIIALRLNGKAFDMAQQNTQTLKDELKGLAFVEGSSITSNLPGDRFSVEGLIFETPGEEDFDPPAIRFLRVDEDFVSLMGIKITEGRDMKQDAGGNSEFLLNQAAISALRLDDPIGINANTYFGQQGEIVGVTENFHYASLQQLIEPLALELNCDPEFRELVYQNLLLRISPGYLSDKVKAIQDKMEELAEDYIMEYTFLEDNVNKNYQSEQKLKELLRAFAVLAIFISCLGLFGLSAFSAELKTKEMGIRKVMGAPLARIVYLMSGKFLVYILIALLIALPLGFFLMKNWLQNFAYHIDIQLWEFVLAGLLALVITLISVGYQAFRSGTANPVDSLRYE